MPALQPALRTLIQTPVYHLARLWEVERTDGTKLYFTDHNAKLTHGGQTYSPVDGVNQSDVERQDSNRGADAEFVGVISDTKITDDDLRAGKYRGAKITERIVDWRYPYIGPIVTNVWFVRNSRWNGTIWRTTVAGLAHKLQSERGKTFTRTCENRLGDGAAGGGGFCTIDILTSPGAEDPSGPLSTPYKWVGLSVDTVTDRVNFRVDSTQPRTGATNTTDDFLDIPSASRDDYFSFGYVEWTTGSNAGLKRDIASNTAVVGTEIKHDFALAVPVPNDIQVGDECTAYVGCDRIFATCRDKFNNVVDHRGYHLMPGFRETVFTEDRV